MTLEEIFCAVCSVQQAAVPQIEHRSVLIFASTSCLIITSIIIITTKVIDITAIIIFISNYEFSSLYWFKSLKTAILTDTDFGEDIIFDHE